MKILGFILVTVSSGVCGMCYYSSKSARVEDLASICSMLEMMKDEISYKLSPMPELVHGISNNVCGCAEKFLSILMLNLSFLGQKNLDTLWRESFEICRPQIGNQETEAILSLGKILGRYDAYTQSEAISKVILQLRTALDKDRTQLPQTKKLSVCVSLTAGAFLAILLV